MKKIIFILMHLLAISCFIIALEVDLELLSIAVMTVGSGTAIWKTIAYISAGIIILKIKNKINK